MQRNWIGRSEGAEFDLPVEGRPDLVVRVFTTRPDTSFGMTYAVMAPEHPLVDELTTAAQREAVEELRRRAAQETEIERMAEGDASTLDKRGAFTGSRVINPFTGGPVPVYVADYVLMGYGTGAIMAVPGRGRARLGLRHPARASDRAHRPAARGLGGERRRCLHRRGREDQQWLPRRARRRYGKGSCHRLARGAGHRRAQGQLPDP